MALIKCPCCGDRISDKAEVCVHCGKLIISVSDREKTICVECGSLIKRDVASCPNCGCPLGIEITGKESGKKLSISNNGKRKNKGKVIFFSILVLSIAVIVVISGTNHYRQNMINEIMQEKESYSENLELAVYYMLESASFAEKVGNITKSVWYNAIFEIKDSETDEYTCPNGYFVSDFSDALNGLFSSADYRNKISSMESNQEAAKNKMKELQNPPTEYQNAYEELKELYDALSMFVGTVKSPSGNYNEFSSNFDGADDNFITAYHAIEIYLN